MDIKLLEKLVFPVYVLSVWPVKFFHSNNCTVHTDKTHTGRRYTKRIQTIQYQNNANGLECFNAADGQSMLIVRMASM